MVGSCTADTIPNHCKKHKGINLVFIVSGIVWDEFSRCELFLLDLERCNCIDALSIPKKEFLDMVCEVQAKRD
jgi:hypothetical protein